MIFCGLGLGRLLLLLILELAVIHRAADGRVGCGGDLDQIDIQLARHAQRFCQADDRAVRSGPKDETSGAMISRFRRCLRSSRLATAVNEIQ